MDDGAVKEKKRARSELVLDSQESDLIRADSLCSDGQDLYTPELKRICIDSDPDSPEVKRFQDELLNILDDSDVVADRDPSFRGLDLVIRSFEEEILVPEQNPVVLDLEPAMAEVKNELGYLLEASDDELGLPPSFGPSEDEQKVEAAVALPVSPGLILLNQPLEFKNELPNYDSFDLGLCEVPDVDCHNFGNDRHFVAIGGLFQYTDDGLDNDNGDASELWRANF
ncbi:hypothetical protein SAY87_007728 [Trapa incisa]|uniref:Uncharacterized protein n=1 Tax=Trapa incisa TaxID=236973 RepID=A0AAN7KKW5_9MYRT|nr:hypothetical protein SAY87_007728 [Trapa incisa]